MVVHGTSKVFLEYVRDIKDAIFTTSKTDLSKFTKKYEKVVPPSLTSQFTERKDKAQAVRDSEARESIGSNLFPAGKQFS